MMGNVCKECGSEKGHYENCPFCDNLPEECGCPTESEFVAHIQKPKKEIGLIWLIFVGVVGATLLTAGLFLIFAEQPV